MAFYRVTANGAAAIAATHVIPAGQYYQLVAVTLNLSAAPTTAGAFTITLDSSIGSEYDTLLYSLDLSASSTTDLFWWPDQPTFLMPGDALDVAYANADGRVYGLTITMRGA